MNRTKNAIRNIFFGFFNKMIMLIFPFFIRSAIIKNLGAEFLGLNSLFISILQVLNLAELGFSSAIVYSMYKPIAEKNTKMVCALLNLYKTIYRCIGIIIFTIGILLLPFLKNLISGPCPKNINIYILYLIYLFNTSITYFLFAYRNSLLVAHQRNDIVSNVQMIINILQYILQIIVLYYLKNYYYFLIIQIIATVLNNLFIAIISKKMYPNYYCDGKLDNQTKKGIKKRVMGLLIQRICSTTRNSLDSIFISMFIGLNAVAIYSNYYSIMNSIIGITSIITVSITAGIGNSIVTETKQKNYNDMNKFNFMYMWISGWFTICLLCLYQPFMKLWMGENMTFPFSVVILFCIYYYSLKMGDIRATYSDAKGLWYENRYRAIAESIANILLNLILGKLFGIYGIIIGTLLSLLVINFGYGSQILFKYYFTEQDIKTYYLNHAIYFFITFIVGVVTYLICSTVVIESIVGLIIKMLICIVIPNILNVIIYHNSDYYKLFKQMVIKLKKNFEKR